jgi:hypothetical protein
LSPSTISASGRFTGKRATDIAELENVCGSALEACAAA